MYKSEEVQFTADDYPYLQKIVAAIDIDGSADNSRIKSWRHDLVKLCGIVSYNDATLLKDHARTDREHSVRQSNYVAEADRELFSELMCAHFLDAKLDGDLNPLLHEVNRVSEYLPRYLSVAMVAGRSSLASLVEAGQKKGITIVADLIPSTMSPSEFTELYGGETLEQRMRKWVYIAQDVGCKAVMCAADVGPALRDDPNIDDDLIIFATGVRINTKGSIHRKPITPAAACLFANYIIAGSELTEAKCPITMLRAYVDDMKSAA